MQENWFDIGGLFLSSFISSTIAPGGSEALLAYLVSEGHYQAGHLILVATVGNTLGAMTTWGLGLVAAKKFPLAPMLSEKNQKALAIVRKGGLWALFFSWLPVIGDAFCFAGGWLKLPIVSGSFAILLGKLSRYAAIAFFFV